MSTRPMRPPTTIPPTTPGLTDEPELAAAWTGIVGMVGADEEEEDEVIEEVLEETMLDALVPLRNAWYALHPM